MAFPVAGGGLLQGIEGDEAEEVEALHEEVDGLHLPGTEVEVLEDELIEQFVEAVVDELVEAHGAGIRQEDVAAVGPLGAQFKEQGLGVGFTELVAAVVPDGAFVDQQGVQVIGIGVFPWYRQRFVFVEVELGREEIIEVGLHHDDPSNGCAFLFHLTRSMFTVCLRSV